MWGGWARGLASTAFPPMRRSRATWTIGYDWWWWRSSRVVSDRDLLGGHIEVIDEFPMFSYILGDNHPHVLAMPVALAVIAMALAVYLTARRRGLGGAAEQSVWLAWRRLLAVVPMGWAGLALIAAVSGGLVFLNTWDYPPYLALLVVALFAGLATSDGEASSNNARRSHLLRSGVAAAAFGAALVAGTLALYLPYFLTAQSQAGGFVPNLFNPTRLRQSLLMFGVFLPAIVGWMAWMWATQRPTLRRLAAASALIFGLPAGFLAISAALALGTSAGHALLERMPLPDGATYASMMVQRWTGQPFTFLLFGGLLAAASALIWQRMAGPHSGDGSARVDLFVLLLAALGLALVYVPEFVYLRDHFGTRMNTVFKFYYQAWLLLALAAAYAVGAGLFADRHRAPRAVQAAMAGTLLLAGLALIFPVAGATSKTLGFRASLRSIDATQYLANDSPAEKAAAEWVLYNTTPDAVVLEAKGASYNSATNRISAVTGRSTLLGWEGHESQWRGEAYGEMAQGRGEALEGIYRSGSPAEIAQLVERWGIDYVYVGPVERSQYEITPRAEERLSAAMDLVFEDGNVRIYRTRGRR